LDSTWNKSLCNMNQAYTISSSLIFIITITILTCEELNDCSNSNIYLPNYVIPVHYHIKLSHCFENCDYYVENKYNIFDYYGESSIIIIIFQSTKYIKLHMINLIIYREKVTLIKNNGVTYALKNYIESYETNLLEFCFFNELSPGLYTLKMEFSGHLTDIFSNNFLKSFYTKKENSIM